MAVHILFCVSWLWWDLLWSSKHNIHIRTCVSTEISVTEYTYFLLLEWAWASPTLASLSCYQPCIYHVGYTHLHRMHMLILNAAQPIVSMKHVVKYSNIVVTMYTVQNSVQQSSNISILATANYKLNLIWRNSTSVISPELISDWIVISYRKIYKYM